MSNVENEESDSNAELHGFEPLRITFAIGALLLVVLLSIH